ncbi:MAG: hypothetical protein HYR96_00560 [Deltaproteobacteria bacterium]|nr:hypothetical protein [Deltaproteobacteria bacterium]
MKESVRGFTALAASSAVLCGPLIIPTLISTVTDHWTGAHSPVDNSMDLLGLFIPGAHWRFSHFTRAYWTQILANGHEASVHLGFGVVILLLTLWFSPPSREKARPWFCLFVTFWILSLGSYLNVWGRELPLGLPYNFLVRNVPGFALSGVPIRFVMIISLAAAVLAAQAFLLLRGTSPALLGALLLVALFEHIPSDLPASPLDVPSYVEKLKLAPEGAVVDLASKETEQLYYQTVHNHPMAFGYIARVPQRLVESGNGIRHLAEEKRFDTLCHDLHFRYLVDTSGSLIDLHTSPGCATQKISLRKN